MEKIFYFTPNCSDELLNAMSRLSEEECEFYAKNYGNEVWKLSPREFESMFNTEVMSDLGFIRIF